MEQVDSSAMVAKDWVAVYAAIVSTLVLIWNIISFRIARKGRVEVRLSTPVQLCHYTDSEELVFQRKNFHIDIINNSDKDRFIAKITIFQSGLWMEFGLDTLIDYPIELTPHKPYHIEIPIAEFLKKITEHELNVNPKEIGQKIEVNVIDTVGQIYTKLHFLAVEDSKSKFHTGGSFTYWIKQLWRKTNNIFVAARRKLFY